MLDIEGKRITIAGKLAGRYAKGRRELLGRLRQLKAELTEEFDASADIVVVAAKASGFRKRITKMNATEITELQLERLVESAFVVPPTPPTRASVWDFVRSADALVTRPASSRELRTGLVRLVCDMSARGYPTALDSCTSFPSEVAGPPRSVLAWCSTLECCLFAIPDDASAAIQRDVAALAGTRVSTGNDYPIPLYAAAMRVLTAMGWGAEFVWQKMKGELDDRKAHAEAGTRLEDLVELGAPLAPHALRVARDFAFPLDRLYVVHDDICW